MAGDAHQTDILLGASNMHTKMLVYLMFFIFEISAGMTEFPCKFPCPWRNKSFQIYNFKRIYGARFSFSGDGQTAILVDSSGRAQLQCYQITERFLIVRKKDTDIVQCYSIFYDLESPLKFQFEQGGASQTFNNQAGELTDICDICVPGRVLEAVVSGSNPTSPPVSSLACNRPSTCTSPPGTACNMNDIIPQGCPVTTTESPTTTTEQTTTRTEARTTTEPTKTTKSHCGKKKHKHTK
ncbi:uncharacterized protein LOC127709174 isoform X3 [Mytilus californianus]|uniref:uncharacterized protein LOC127709174 isoform X2 n=1 Tax=Mytilus californianus TaxID=6549 RepID=UPI0022461119|nr:uncharacterized protein LOC127709174 isoform X2 [Mytilus californianus]XP_052070491.1 uncharacterized protein LOC127709174 isoform X3 [Mytilus californianus]